MTDETRNISFNIQATQAIRTLTSLGTQLDKFSTLVGTSNQNLTRAEKVMQTYSQRVAEASGAISNLKSIQKSLQSSLAASNKQLASQQSAINNARTATASAKQMVKEYAQGLAQANKTIATQRGQIDGLRNAVISYQTAARGSAKQQLINSGQIQTLREVQNYVSTINSELIKTRKSQGGAAFGITTASDQPLQKYISDLSLGTQGQVKFNAASEKMLASNIKQKAAVQDVTGQNVALRYALYSVGATFGVVAAAGEAAFGNLIQAGISYQSQIASVIRTSQVASPQTFAGSPLVSAGILTQAQQAADATQSLTQAFLDLQDTLPVTSADLTEIATLGSQMGIAASQIESFTQTTAEFSAATGISANDAATGLARLSQLVPTLKTATGNYSSLASAILKTGVNSIATEGQILQTAQNIAGIATVAHLSQNNVIALSSATASLGITSELARSALTQSFTKILTATNEGASGAEKFGKVMGISGQQFITAFGKNSYKTFTDLMGAIANSSDPIGELQALGLASQRLTPTLLKLGQNTDVLNKTQADTTKGAKQNVELQRQFGIIAATTASKVQVLSQAWNGFLVTIGGPTVKFFGEAAGAISGFVNWLSAIANNPAGKVISSIVIGIGVLVTALTAVIAAIALGGASLLGINYVFESLAASSIGTTAAMVPLAGAIEVVGDESLATSAKVGILNGLIDVSAAKSSIAGLGFAKMGKNILGTVAPALAATAALAALYALLNSSGTLNPIQRSIQGESNSTSALVKSLVTKTKPVLAGSGADGFDKINNGSNVKLSSGEVSFQRGLGGVSSALAGNLVGSSVFANIQQADTQLATLAKTNGPAAEKQLLKLQKAWVASGQGADTFKDAFPDTIAALDLATGKTGASTAALKKYYETQKQEAAASQNAADVLQEQADDLGLLTDQYTTAQQAHDSYIQSVQASATSGITPTDDITNAFTARSKTNPTGGGGIGGLQTQLNSQIAAYQKWSAGVQKLTAEGAGSLAQAFIAAGPSSQSAVTAALKLSPKSLGALNDSMREAAFYASQAYAEMFDSQNSVLADVYKKTLDAGGNAQGALSDAIHDLGSGDALSPQAIAALDKKYHINISVSLNDVDPADVTNVEKNAQDAANAKPVQVPVKFNNTNGLSTGAQLPSATKTEYAVSEAGHSILLKVNPDTAAGTKILNQWRASNYGVSGLGKLKIDVDTTSAAAKVAALRAKIKALQAVNLDIHGVLHLPHGEKASFAKGGKVGNYATGGLLNGPGTGTSDSMLAHVSTGEYINTAAAVRYYGADLFDRLNRRVLPRFAQGGPVGSYGGGSGAGATMNVNVVQNYPTTVDPIAKLKQDAENIVAGIWTL